MDGKKIQQPQQVAVILFSKQIGDLVKFTVKRSDATVSSVDVAITRRARDPENILDPARLSENIVPRLGIIAVPLSPEVAKLIPPTRMEHGLVVVALTAEGKAASMDLQVGDVLYTLNRNVIDSVQGLREMLAKRLSRCSLNETESCNIWPSSILTRLLPMAETTFGTYRSEMERSVQCQLKTLQQME
jgi:hypothetical protein